MTTDRRSVDPVAFCPVKRHFLAIHREEILPKKFTEGREKVAESANHRVISTNGIPRLDNISNKQDDNDHNSHTDHKHEQSGKRTNGSH
jgi:hypothetical protein